MLKRSLLTWMLITILSALGAQVIAQGVTTASMSGVISDQKGEGLPGATVVALHTPSGTQYATATRPDGRFNFPNVRVGGPYSITVTFVGYQEHKTEGVNLALGQDYTLNVRLQESNVQLQEIVVTGQGSEILNADRTGAATNVSNQTIQATPTVSRGLRDFTRLSPLANTSGNGTSFAGTNNRFNQFAIDGIVNNDVFGLSGSGTNGGQTGIEPVSLDAIEEFQINIAPYDVRQGGFTGGGVNAVTRSGTNKFQGSVYYFGNNEKLVGRRNPRTGEEQSYPDYRDFQTGFRIGGPVIKNKLFFFLNGEITRQRTPLANEPGSALSNITVDEVNQVLSVLQRVAPGYDPGSFLSIEDEVNSNKLLGRLDWNINTNHKLTLRHSYTYGENIDNSRSPNRLAFYNNGQFFPSTTNSTGLELNSTFPTFSNRLLVGYTRVRDDRDILGNPFPFVNINIGSGRSIVLGSENSSVANQLDQNILSITDDFSLYRGKHTITLGTNNEFYSFYNLFVQNIYGNYAYRSLADFATIGTPDEVAPTQYQIGYSFQTDDDPSQNQGAAEFNAMQLGLYLQDEFRATERLKVTAGLRVDLPVFSDTPGSNAAFNEAYAGANVATGVMPKSRLLFAPRVGFNWDVMGDRSLQVRGGTGLFTGRVPFVWISNQFTNNGQLNGTYQVGNAAASANPLTDPAGLRFSPNPFAQPRAEDLVGPNGQPKLAGRGAVNVVDPNLRFPQVFRTNLAVDKTLPWGLVATLEGIFSKTYNNVNFQNLNRQVDPDFAFEGPDQRPRFFNGRLDPNFEEIVLFQNTNQGYSYNLVAQLQKQFDKNFQASIAYTFGESKDLNSGTSSVAYSNWRFANSVRGANDLELSYSNFDVRHRVVGLVSYRKEYLKGSATQVSLFYNGQSGQPLSYIYNGDLNNDQTGNDLVYIPRNASEITLVTSPANRNNITATPEEQWTALNAFIESDPYLSERRGQYAQRNGARLPFQHQFDFRILQEFGVNVGNNVHKLQFSFDVINVGNLLNKEWGRQYNVANQAFSLVNYEGLQGNLPTFSYSERGLTNGQAYAAIDDLSNNRFSRWRAQFGIRYLFN